MKTVVLFLLLAAWAPAASARDMVIAVSAEGEPRYGPIFEQEARTWRDAASPAGIEVRDLGAAKRGELREALDALPREGDDLWLVLIGHGTFDGKTAKFNLQGDDVSSAELAAWLAPFHRRVIVWNLFSASGAFVPDLSQANRVIVSATRSGSERNYARFGEMLAESLADADADLDGDGMASIVELVANATARTKASYENDQRIVVEHALLDDNGDGAGTEAAALLDPKPAAGRKPDGAVAADISLVRDNNAPALTADQIRRRDALEKRIAALRAKKTEMSGDAYFRQLEALLLDLAQIYREGRASGRP